jgi:hypothetical protein
MSVYRVVKLHLLDGPPFFASLPSYGLSNKYWPKDIFEIASSFFITYRCCLAAFGILNKYFYKD